MPLPQRCDRPRAAWHNVAMPSSPCPARRARSLRAVVFCAVAWLFAPAALLAQQRPLQTQDPEPVGAGNVLVGVGFDHGTGVLFPASGLKGTLTRVPVIGLAFGVSPIAEIELSGGP